MSVPLEGWWQYFGASQPPFTRNLPVTQLFHATAWQEAQARVESTVRDPGFLVLTGESGVGKTTVLRSVLQPLNPSQYRLCYLTVAEDWTERHLYRALAQELGLPWAPTADAMEAQVRQTCWTLTTQHGQLPIVVLDEGHLLSPHALQGLRRLLNFEFDTTAPLALVLVGHTELRRKLALRPLEAIRQRVTVAYQLPPLTAAETTHYLEQQLHQVGIERPVFADAAMARGYTWSQGIPRRINHWARATLLAAYATPTLIIDEAIVTMAEAEWQWAGAV